MHLANFARLHLLSSNTKVRVKTQARTGSVQRRELLAKVAAGFEMVVAFRHRGTGEFYSQNG